MSATGVRRLTLLVIGSALLAACGEPDRITAPGIRVRTTTIPRARMASVDGESVAIAQGHVVARFADGVDAEAAARAAGGTVERELALGRAYLIAVEPGSELAVASTLAGQADVEFAEPDVLMAIEPCGVGSCATPTDGFFGYKWDLHNNGSITGATGNFLGLTGHVDADIDWLEMFDALGADFSGSATIGILDTGIRTTHQDLAGRVVLQRNFATGYAPEKVEDIDSHGTHVAGIAAARGNNAVGVSGVAYAPNIRIINAKVCERYLFADDSVRTSCPSVSTAEAIVWATDNGANVLNMSLGGSPTAATGSAAQRAALQYARAHDVLPFCATGNDNYPAVSFPARFPECVAVAATNWSDRRASYSNYGPEVALTAPGGDVESLPAGNSLILSAALSADNTYSWKAGTSMASPAVAGLAAMLYATGLTDDDAVLARLEETADDLGAPGRDAQFGFGRVNAYRAVTGETANDPPVPELFRQGATMARVGEPFYLFGRFTDDDADSPWRYTFSWGDGTTTEGTLETLPPPNALQYGAKSWSAPGTYTVRFTVSDRQGYAGFAQRTVTVVAQ